MRLNELKEIVESLISYGDCVCDSIVPLDEIKKHRLSVVKVCAQFDAFQTLPPNPVLNELDECANRLRCDIYELFLESSYKDRFTIETIQRKYNINKSKFIEQYKKAVAHEIK